MSVDPRFERSVLAELALRERRARQRQRHHDRTQRARELAEKVHRGSHDLLAHLRRVAFAVPRRFRAVDADRLDPASPNGEMLTALVLLPDPELAR